MNDEEHAAMAPDGLMVRAALREDAADIARIFVESWRETYADLLPSSFLVRLSPARQKLLWLREIVRHGPSDGVLVSESDAYGVIGFASYGPARDKAVGYDGEIYTLYVDPNHMGHGAGRALMLGAFAQLNADGCRSAVVWALKGNPARFFYEGSGGRFIAERPGAIAGRPVREIAFGWRDLSAVLGTRVR